MRFLAHHQHGCVFLIFFLTHSFASPFFSPFRLQKSAPDFVRRARFANDPGITPVQSANMLTGLL
jgi:hypothetical protein